MKNKEIEIEIEFETGRGSVKTPYLPAFVTDIKNIGGARWDGNNKCWTFAMEDLELVRDICVKNFGYNDVSSNATVNIKATFVKRIYWDCAPAVLFNKTIATAFGRDSGAKIAKDVCFIAGGAKSGGSVKNWYTEIGAGSVVIIKNVDKNIFETTKDKYDKEEIIFEIIENDNNDKEKLTKEMEQLEKRLAEIKTLLSKMG